MVRSCGYRLWMVGVMWVWYVGVGYGMCNKTSAMVVRGVGNVRAECFPIGKAHIIIIIITLDI